MRTIFEIGQGLELGLGEAEAQQQAENMFSGGRWFRSVNLRTLCTHGQPDCGVNMGSLNDQLSKQSSDFVSLVSCPIQV